MLTSDLKRRLKTTKNRVATGDRILANVKKVAAVCVLISLAPLGMTKESVSRLMSDGPEQGLSAYELIQAFAGKKSIESPDLYSQNHPGVKHIYEDIDSIVGHHFVFELHRDIDKDRDKYIQFSDRQRNEIKAYSGSSSNLKGFEGETLSYRWKFKVGADMSLSKNFSHFFQLKSVDDGIGMPILTISGVSYKGERWLGLSHAAVQKSSILLKRKWEDISDVWLEAQCTVTYSNAGSLEVNVKRLDNNEEVMSYQSDSIDMWRGTKGSHFVRPKWGYYRSLKSKNMLENEVDTIRFAEFTVIKQHDSTDKQ